jgi:hypothetical protein
MKILLIGVICAWANLAAAQSQYTNWNCSWFGNQYTCQGFVNGRYVTCTTYYVGNQSYTQCY